MKDISHLIYSTVQNTRERYNIRSIFCQWPEIMQAFTFQEWDILRTSCCKEWFSDVTERISDPGMLVAYRACSDYL